ncbi:MAG: peroxiredoxin [Methylococcales bacterium]|nr:peroxiredoxin [Methylococcales bacterium]
MQKLLFSLLSLALTVFPVQAALQAGAQAPQFSTQASLAGKDFHYALADALQKGPVVVYFYPSAFTRGCNIQAHEFAEHIDQFAAAGASVVGVSLDSIERLNAFSADPEYCAGKFPVASDADGQIAKAFQLSVREARPGKKDSRGVEIDHGFAERTTFVITQDGNIAAVLGGLSPSENVQQALASVKQLAGNG